MVELLATRTRALLSFDLDMLEFERVRSNHFLVMMQKLHIVVVKGFILVFICVMVLVRHVFVSF